MLNLDELEAIIRSHNESPYWTTRNWEEVNEAWFKACTENLLPLIAECRELRTENERYRKALEEYACPDNWDDDFPDEWIRSEKATAIAREALRG